MVNAEIGSRNERIGYHIHKEGVQVNSQTCCVYVDTKFTFSMHCEKGKYG